MCGQGCSVQDCLVCSLGWQEAGRVVHDISMNDLLIIWGILLVTYCVGLYI